MIVNKNGAISHPVNRQIRAPRIRLVFEDINEIMTLGQALAFASERDLDLVQFGSGDCPTCRLIDYNKYKYHEEKKRKSEQSSKHCLKEIQLRPSISANDLQVKSRHIIGFLEKGNDVRVRIKLRGREKANSDQHGLFLVKFAESFQQYAKVDGKMTAGGVPVGGVVTLKPIKMNKNS